jgi:glycosyltransferase involved in cell wall biosynthesis
MHDFPESKRKLFSFFLKRIDLILIHNKWKYEKFFELFNFSKEKVIFLPNAVEINDFDIPIRKEKARELVNFPKDKFIVVYTGHLYSWKGVDTLVESVKYLTKDFLVIVIGGTESDVSKFKKKYLPNEKLLFLGHREHGEIPIFQKSADLLVLPNTARENISKYYTSPMKLFEYMASSRPILASNIPSIKEILDENMATFFEADNSEDLANKIMEVRKLYNEKEGMSKRAFNKISDYSWEGRAIKILNFIKKGYGK